MSCERWRPAAQGQRSAARVNAPRAPGRTDLLGGRSCGRDVARRSLGRVHRPPPSRHVVLRPALAVPRAAADRWGGEDHAAPRCSGGESGMWQRPVGVSGNGADLGPGHSVAHTGGSRGAFRAMPRPPPQGLKWPDCLTPQTTK